MTSKSILVVAAHPDDEALGCGGTIAKYAQSGATANVAFIADGVTSRDGATGGRPDQVEARRAAAARACRLLGAAPVHFGDFPDNRLDTFALLDVVKIVEGLIVRFRPDTVFTHHACDLNVDHRLVHQAVVTACRPQPGSRVRTLLTFEVPSSTEWQLRGSAAAFAPNWHVDITATLPLKLQALDEYAAELRPWPHARSREAVEHLARWRGASVGVAAAEAFALGRQLS